MIINNVITCPYCEKEIKVLRNGTDELAAHFYKKECPKDPDAIRTNLNSRMDTKQSD